MSTTPPDATGDRPPQAARLAPKLRALADQGVYFGTSSWKYDGWLGSIYTADRYLTRGKFSQKKFEVECLAEYAQTFPTVCFDGAFYGFYGTDYWRKLFDATPPNFLIGTKVAEDITVAKWPGHARFGKRAGLMNEHFLNAEDFKRFYLAPLEPFAERLGPVIFEFGTFAKAIFATPADFMARLEPFLAALPAGPSYSIEIRNPEYLSPAYFDLLARHKVAHVFNAWTRAPALSDQIQLPGAFTADFTVVRALLTKGLTYEKAVEAFEPYKLVQEPNEAARDAMWRIATRSREGRTPAFVFVNNRLEGHAPTTIEAVVDMIGAPPV
jgi:uncharacterized protein YecE (DUF72 family)